MISLITIVSCLVISTTMFAYANLDQAKKAFSSKDYQKAYSAIQAKKNETFALRISPDW